MIESWRWYGPQDPVTLSDIAQAGATGIVTALHQIPNGEVWPIDAIMERKQLIEDHHMQWVVVESVPVHEDIKTGRGNIEQYLENYRQTLLNLGECGIPVVCYNFMPILDWTRTDLAYTLPNGAKALRFDQIDFAVFELFLLQRSQAKDNYTAQEVEQAQARFANMSEADKSKLINNIIAGLPGAEEHYTIEQFRNILTTYDDIDAEQLRQNLQYFLQQVIPSAQQAGVKMAIHPDDPPRPILGLPRVVSTLEDMDAIRAAIDSPANGFTFCTGSYGVRSDNDLINMARAHADRIYFAHLRATQRDQDNPKSFHEANHLEGDVDMYKMIELLLEEQAKRPAQEAIPMRPDHGHQMIDDLHKTNMNPGYTCIGRLKGLAELRGVIYAINRAKNDANHG